MDQQSTSFEKRGIRVAAITPDSVAVLRHFSDRMRLRIPLLSDAGSHTIRAFGILNDNIPPDNPFFGTPFPGSYLLDREGRIKSKYFEPDDRERFTAAAILVKEFNTGAAPGQQITTPHLTLRTSASNAVAYPGSRFTLLLDVALPRRMHVYAPGVAKPYLPVAWDVEPSSALLALPAAFPAPRTLRLPAIRESAPVFENRFRLTRDIVVSLKPELESALNPQRQLIIRGTFRYQACDDKICYLPQTVPLEWRITIQPQDRVRVPAPLRGQAR